MTAARRRVLAFSIVVVLVVGALTLGASLAPAQDTQLTPAEQKEQAESKRLQLDIARLRREAGREARVQRWLPGVSVIVAVIAAAYGVWRYFDERRRTEASRTEEAIDHNLERLTERPSDANPNARAITALRALDHLAPVESDDKAARRRSDVTRTVTAIVRDDITIFETRHDARLPVICLDFWPDFQDVAAEDPELCREVLARYNQALETVREHTPVFMERVERGDSGYTAPVELSASDALLFPAAVTGFERYLALIATREDRDEAIRRFSASAEKLGPQLFRGEP